PAPRRSCGSWPGLSQCSLAPPGRRAENGPVGGSGLGAVQPLAHFLAGLEERHVFLIDGDMGAGARITAWARRTGLDREGTEAAQLNPVPAGQGRDDLAEDGVDDVLDISLVEVWVRCGDSLNEL